MVQSTENVEKCRLARTGRPEQDNELAREEIEIGTRKGVHLDLPIAIGLREALGTEYGLGHLLPDGFNHLWFKHNAWIAEQPETHQLGSRAERQSRPKHRLQLDSAGAVQYVNLAAEHLFGYSRRKAVEILVPDGLRQRYQRHRQAFFEAPAARPMGKGCASRNGSVKAFATHRAMPS